MCIFEFGDKNYYFESWYPANLIPPRLAKANEQIEKELERLRREKQWRRNDPNS